MDFQEIFEAAPDLYLVLLPDLTIVAASNCYLEATHTTREQVIGRNIFDIFPDNPADSAATGVKNLQTSLQYTLLHRKPHAMAVQKYDVKTPDGLFEIKYWSPLNTPVLDKNNEVVYIIHKVEDVTEFITTRERSGNKIKDARESGSQVNEMETDIYKRAQEIQLFNMELQQQVDEKTAELRAVFDRISDAFIGLDRDGNFMYANKQAENELGMNARQLYGKNIWEVFPKEVLDQLFADAFRESMATHEHQHVELYSSLYRSWFEIHLYPSHSGVSIFFRDISERKKAEELLKASEYKYKLLFESNPLPMWMLSMPERNFIAVNSAALQSYGYTRDEFLKMNAIDIRPAEDVDRFLAQTPAADAGIRRAGIWRHKRKDGTVMNVDIITHDIFYEGKPARLVLANDITDRIKTEEALRQSEEITRLIMSSSLDAIICIDKTGKIIFWNPRAEKIFGWAKEEIIEKQLTEIIATPDSGVEEHDKSLRHFLEAPEGPVINKLVEITAINKAGNEFYIQLAIIPVREDANEFYCCFVQDITERKKSEEKLKESHEQLRQLTSHLQDVREEEQKRIAREVHDELGQQITGLKMDIAWLTKKITGVKEISPIEDKLREMTSLLDSAVQTIRKIASELRPSILDDLGLIAALEWQTYEFQKRFSIPVELKITSQHVEPDPAIATGLFRLYQESLTNIARHAQAHRVTASLSVNADEIIFTVADNGKGFDLQEAENKKTLGLLGMKERVLMMNGKLIIQSEPGKGTTFTIIIPVV